MKNTGNETNYIKKELFKYLLSQKGNINIGNIEQFLNSLDTSKILTESCVNDYAQIRIINEMTEIQPELGYSIKSKLGHDSTLINAGGDNTNFIFKISGISRGNITSVNNEGAFKKKFKLLDSLGTKVDFYGVASQEFRNNLNMLDLGMERIVAECLLSYYRGAAKTIEDAVRIVNKKDPFNIIANASQPMYEYKVKQFLLAFALGMTPSKAWQGKFNANGGFIVVKEDGDIVCYHFFDRNDLEDYLFYNTRFETPSKTRHKFGTIYEVNGEFYMKLNLQVRFKR